MDEKTEDLLRRYKGGAGQVGNHRLNEGDLSLQAELLRRQRTEDVVRAEAADYSKQARLAPETALMAIY